MRKKIKSLVAVAYARWGGRVVLFRDGHSVLHELRPSELCLPPLPLISIADKFEEQKKEVREMLAPFESITADADAGFVTKSMLLISQPQIAKTQSLAQHHQYIDYEKNILFEAPSSVVHEQFVTATN
jgi:hypothetical protein